MAYKASIRRYRNWYAKLLHLYPKAHRERFGEGMEQTFNDLCRERVEAERGLFGFALWMFFETCAEIIRENKTSIFMENKKIIRIVLATAILLLLPLLAMQVSDEVAWTPTDFAAAAVLLVGSGLLYVLATRKADNIAHRVAVGVAVATAFILVWMNLAVGLIGSEDNPANLMYGGVLAVGLIGAAIARFQPHGMARALFATALAQALVPVIALIIWKPEGNLGVVGVFVLNAFFVALWAGSALLFRHASAPRNTV